MSWLNKEEDKFRQQHQQDLNSLLTQRRMQTVRDILNDPLHPNNRQKMAQSLLHPGNFASKKHNMIESLIRQLTVKTDISILRQAEVITSSEMISLLKMVNSPDVENLVVAETIVKQKLSNIK